MKRIILPTMNIKLKFFSVLVLFIFYVNHSYAQLTAKFVADVSEGCTPLLVHFTNQSTSGDSISYFWVFGNGYTSSAKDPSTTYNNGSIYTVTLTISDTKNNTTTSYSQDINAIATASANLSINKTTACVNEYVTFAHGYLIPDSVYWNFGDGKSSKEFYLNPLPHAYSANGNYTVTYITYNKYCSDTSTRNITITGPVTSFSMSQDEACIFEDITFMIGSTTDITSVLWDFGDGATVSTDTAVHNYKNWGYPIIPKLIVTGLGRTCSLEDTIRVFHVEAGIGYSDQTLFCDERYIYFQNSSTGNDINLWDFGDNTSGAQVTPQHIYQTGNMGAFEVSFIYKSLSTLLNSYSIPCERY